jgi:hypothetical protein
LTSKNTTNHKKTKDTPTKKRKEDTAHYVDNKKFFTEMVKYSSSIKLAVDTGKPKPQVSDYIGECIWKIAEKLSHLHQFRKYPFRDELVQEAILNCLQYIDNFDPEKSNNPFAYFTRICWFAFLRRIEKEKKYLYTKYKSIENTEIFHHVSDNANNDGINQIQYSESARENMVEFVEKFETSLAKKKARKEERDADTDNS